MSADNFLLRRALWAWIIAFFVLRFFWVSDTIFILDEPLFQMRIDEHLAAGTIPLSSFRGSSIPLPYGPGALWLYMLVRLFTWHPYVIAAFHTLVVTAGALLFLRAIWQRFGEEAARYTGLLLATSPLLFYYSRHPWDNTMLVTVSAIVIWSLIRLEEKRKEILYHALAGAAVGYGLNIHLMFGPIAVATGLTLVLRALKFHSLRSREFWLPLLAFGAAAIAVLLPYAWEAWHIMQMEKPLEHTRHTVRWGDGRNVWWNLQRSVVFSSVWGARIYLDTVHQYFHQFTGRVPAFFFHNDLFGWFGKIAAVGVTLAYPIQYFRGTKPFDTLRVFAFLGLACVMLVLQYLNIPTAPHYFHSIWWLVFLGLAVAIPLLRGWGKKLFLATLLLTALVNSTYVMASMLWLHGNKGARSFQYSVTISEQMRAVREICTEAAARIPAEARVNLEPAFILGPSFPYLASHMPECRGVKFISGRPLADPTFVISHPKDSDHRADLIIEWLPPR